MPNRDAAYFDARAARERKLAETAALWIRGRHIAAAEEFERRATIARAKDVASPPQPKRIAGRRSPQPG